MTNRLRLGRIAPLLVAVGACVLGSMPPARAAEPAGALKRLNAISGNPADTL